MTVTIHLTPDLESRLRDRAARNGMDFDAFVSEAVEQRLREVAADPPPLSADETKLLLEINRGLPAERWARYHALAAKRRAESLTADEHRELVAISGQIEIADAKRLGHLIELAKLRRTSLQSLMDDLGIRPPPAE